MAIAKPLHKMNHDQDPADMIRRTVGDVANVELTGLQILVGTYIRPEKTSGGLLLTQKTREEDFYQGKVGLVLKMADGAFEETDKVKFSVKIKVGDWIVYYPQDTHSLSLNGHHCRLVEEGDVRMRVPNPDMVL